MTMNQSEPQGFGKWLKFMREQRGMNQTELAELVGRKQPTIKPPLRTGGFLLPRTIRQAVSKIGY